MSDPAFSVIAEEIDEEIYNECGMNVRVDFYAVGLKQQKKMKG